MTIFDYVVLFVLIASIIVSTLRGLVKEMLSLLGWIVAFVVANAYSAALAVLLPAVIPGEIVRLIVAFLALFIGVRMLMGLLSMAVSALIEAGGMSLADRGLGGLFGLGRGLVIVLAGVILCGMTSIPQQDFWREAMFSPIAETGVRTVKPFLPAAVAQHVQF
ncbi:CvpA family protein [Pseudoduganella albidiflava]|uniref:Colicin V biosynthesis protein n=1 Tax=Pseudoduganella albidiflava TaxID=321983 RepID=A0A411WUB3_9BURK|nr:CvpA family protein [Pseudoduganella albidiflava]QBI00346.1 CvpA family protein [Pseudoduganella albidiflava]GGY53137.1 colicin V biosynthesis protein [Pseudoduganella albidiflava]